jgi:hypothetical protein
MRSLIVATVLLASCKVSSSDWKREMENQIPQAFCEPTQYFRQCFDVDEATCRSTVTELVRTCFAKIQLPESMGTGDGESYGRKLGECAGGGYDDKLSSKRNNNPKCLDPKNWE